MLDETVLLPWAEMVKCLHERSLEQFEKKKIKIQEESIAVLKGVVGMTNEQSRLSLRLSGKTTLQKPPVEAGASDKNRIRPVLLGLGPNGMNPCFSHFHVFANFSTLFSNFCF